MAVSTISRVRNWTIVEHAADRVVLKIVDADGRGGYPGNCTIQATYHVHGSGELSVTYETTSDQPTIANICQHAYFNLTATTMRSVTTS
jgi:aldose 1-epimerase